MSKPTIPTTGNNPLDGELLDLRKRLDQMQRLIDGLTTAAPTSTPPVQPLPPPLGEPPTIYIGEPVGSGTPGSVLFLDSVGALGQDNANFYFDATNHRFGLGPIGTAPIARFHQSGTAVDDHLIERFANAAQFTGRRANGSAGAPSAVNTDEYLCEIRSFAYGATGWSSAVRGDIAIKAAENWTDAHQGTYFAIQTTQIGTTITVDRFIIDDIGRVSLTGNPPAAYLDIPAGSATAGHAPIRFAAGTNLTSAVAGAVEWDGTRLYLTQTTGPTRKTVAYTTDVGTSGHTRDVAVLTNGATLSADATKIYIRIVNAPAVNSPTITLPDPAVHTGAEIWIRYFATQDGTINIARHGSEKIDNVASDVQMHSTGPTMRVYISDGTNWWTIGTEV